MAKDAGESPCMIRGTVSFTILPRGRCGKRRSNSGGQANRAVVLPADAADFPLRSGKDVAVLLADTINQVRKGLVQPKIASIVGYLSGPLMKALETSDTEERLAKVEHASANAHIGRIAI